MMQLENDARHLECRIFSWAQEPIASERTSSSYQERATNVTGNNLNERQNSINEQLRVSLPLISEQTVLTSNMESSLNQNNLSYFTDSTTLANMGGSPHG